MRLIIAGFALLLSGNLPVEASETWSPTSTTAIAITGEISIDGNRLTFGNGVSISLKPVGADRPGVYVIDPPQNPVLMNGNRLCGEEMPTFLVLARAGNSLYFKAFDSPEAPVASADPLPQSGTCATYNFERASDRSARDVSPGQSGQPTNIRQAQDALNALGYDAGPADGVMGRRTKQALSAFQRDRGLPVTGTADQRTLSELGREGQPQVPALIVARPGIRSSAQSARLPSSAGSTRNWQRRTRTASPAFPLHPPTTNARASGSGLKSATAAERHRPVSKEPIRTVLQP